MTIGTIATWLFLWIAVSVVFGLGLGQWMQTQSEAEDWIGENGSAPVKRSRASGMGIYRGNRQR